MSGARRAGAAEVETIPARLNLLLAAGVFVGAIALLIVASGLRWYWQLPLGIVFAFLLLTNYALMHEAAHGVLHPSAPVNCFVGVLLSWLFPMSFTVFRITHVAHHCCNRTDHELFDYYYAHDRLLIKRIQWYGVLLGFWYLLIPIGNLLLAMAPGVFRTRVFRHARTTAVLFDDFDAAAVRRVRLEVLGCVALWSGLLTSGWLDIRTLVLFYLMFGFNWSTRQFVTHAFTTRSVRSGALNLRTSRLMQCILLNGHWDQVHHEHPHLSWYVLPRCADRREPRIGYARQYLAMWRGPRPCVEPAPSILPRLEYDALT